MGIPAARGQRSNAGKSALFNALTGARQKTGNYPGVTVEKKIGTAVLAGASFDVLDLPGLYSLKAAAPDEQLASDALMGRIEGEDRPDLIVYVADATNLKRNLLVYSQLVELFKRSFRAVKAIKPKASRGRSAETFLVGIGLKNKNAGP